MTPQAQGVRALGDVLTAIGAWRRHSALIVLGWAVVAAGWSGGLLRGWAAEAMAPNGA
jgi:hypothetical protein